ncbi:hypothetical protein AB0N24_22985 [Arthrobacter sp. NPDC093128]|uniref:ORC-CDC6 family AAA ATPase n=1 Tax=Arthrobacter sp. NPDC093128 TaxID=3154979 RepID=UPI00341CD28D
MSSNEGTWAFDTFNAKKLSPREIAGSFVVPSSFSAIASADHCYVIGPRGSGKTTLLRMLGGESLMAWHGADAANLRGRINYSSIFLPADQLWASQTSPATARAAFTAQMLYAFVETMMYRISTADSSGNEVHLPVTLAHEQEVSLAAQCAKAWGLEDANPGFLGLQEALDIYLMGLSQKEGSHTGVLGGGGSISLLNFGVRAFNRIAKTPHHRWALLLDEMELAPEEIHSEVTAFVRGGAKELILKVSMSPFDRYMHSYGAGGAPIPGHDFQTIYLSGQSRREIQTFTNGLWKESLRSRNFAYAPMARALGTSSGVEDAGARSSEQEMVRVLRRAQSQDGDLARWLKGKFIDLGSLEMLSYNRRSATVRKIFPLVVFRDAILSFRDGRPVRRSRKKSIEPFTGARAVTTLLEGNPRWIKTAFSQMLNFYDPRNQTISPGFQYDALVDLANRFESLLRVLPQPQAASRAFPVTELVDGIATYLNRQNTSAFTPDPQNCFTVDGKTPTAVIDALVLGLYGGAFVHVRDRRSPAVLSDFRGQRFRLAYLLAIRDGKEFPLRLGKDVKITTIFRSMEPTLFGGADSDMLELEFG